MIHEKPFKLSGQTVKLRNGAEYRIEDYVDRVLGRSWKMCNGNPCALKYAVRSAVDNLPLDDEVLYGKIDGIGEMVHVSEIAI